jgi:fibronectin-binding autotransporter adhesin
MSQVYKSTTGGGAGLVNSVAGTSPIQANGVSGVPQTGAVTVSILNALADGVTKGASTYNATEFSSAAGLITSNAISTSLSGGLTGSASFNLGGTLTLGFAGGGAAIESVAVNKGGTNPVTPNGSGQISILGNFVAGNAGNNPVATDGNMSNGFTIEVQTATAQLASSSANLGLASFKSADFSVDGNGFVSFSTTGAVKTLTGNSGGAIAPVAGNINTLGTGSITIAGAGSTLTTQLTGLTNHAVLIGAGTATITNVGPTATSGQVLQSAGAAADPVFSTATYPATTTVSQILYSSSSNTVTGLATANSATLVTTSAGVPVFSGTMTNGQMIIGSTGATPTTGTITSTGGTITVSTGAGTLNLEVVGGLSLIHISEPTRL